MLGQARFPSPIRRCVSDRLRVPEEIVRDSQAPPAAEELPLLIALALRLSLAGAKPQRYRRRKD